MQHTASTYFKQFIQQEAAGGILLIIAAILAIFLANSPLASFYTLLIDTPVELRVGALEIAKPLLLWVNDGLMAIFFLLVGLELKRELLIGELSKPGSITLPAAGAVGGMLVPAAIYIWLNMDDPAALKGWAIPAATDIAFALGILSLLGNRVPVSIKIFLTSLAIFDDIGAILIIAFFYTSQLSLSALITAAACTAVLYLLNRKNISERSLYFFVGGIMWVALLKSGVHATLAGVLLAAFIPLNHRKSDEPSPLISLEHDLHSLVAFAILPIFAFCNAGINLSGVGFSDLTHPMPLGIILGLFVGKQIGILGLCWLSIRLRLASLPRGINWKALWGTSILCGVGFTMSLFIGSLAFEETGVNKLFDERLGILVGSLLSGIAGYAVLNCALKQKVEQGG